MDVIDFAAIIKRELKFKGMSQQDLADNIGVSRQQIGSWLKGQDIKLHVLRKVAKGMGVGCQVFFKEGEFYNEPTNVLKEPPASYGDKYLEQRVDDLETKMREFFKNPNNVPNNND